MNWFKDNTYSSVRDAIINSVGDQGLISVWKKDDESQPVVFLNGKPVLSFEETKEEVDSKVIK